MANILLAGDSWGIGVFADQGQGYGPTGQGIASILTSQGHTVYNISKAGGSNWLMIDRLEGNWNNTKRCLFGVDPRDRIEFDLAKMDHIIFLQTDIFRERHYYDKQHPDDVDHRYKILEQKFVDSLLDCESLEAYINSYFARFYTRLDRFIGYYHKKVLMLGCWSQLHPSIVNYPNLVNVATSATKLLIPELERDVYMSDAEWYTQLADNPRFMQKFGKEFKPMTIDAENKLMLICKYWKEVHPDLQGYQRLTDVLVKKF